MEKLIKLSNENATVEFGQALSTLLVAKKEAGVTLYLEGTLGAGKTTFCRGVLTSLGHSGAVKSPTYTLVEPYDLPLCEVYHFDLYRLAGAEELEYMGIRDYFNNGCIRLIEWPEKGEGILPKPDIRLSFEVSGLGRAVTIRGESEVGKSIVTLFV